MKRERRPVTRGIGILLTGLLVGLGVAVPMLDAEPFQTRQTVHDASQPGSTTFCHDHTLCVLWQVNQAIGTAPAVAVWFRFGDAEAVVATPSSHDAVVVPLFDPRAPPLT